MPPITLLALTLYAVPTCDHLQLAREIAALSEPAQREAQLARAEVEASPWKAARIALAALDARGISDADARLAWLDATLVPDPTARDRAAFAIQSGIAPAPSGCPLPSISWQEQLVADLLAISSDVDARSWLAPRYRAESEADRRARMAHLTRVLQVLAARQDVPADTRRRIFMDAVSADSVARDRALAVAQTLPTRPVDPDEDVAMLEGGQRPWHIEPTPAPPAAPEAEIQPFTPQSWEDHLVVDLLALPADEDPRAWLAVRYRAEPDAKRRARLTDLTRVLQVLTGAPEGSPSALRRLLLDAIAVDPVVRERALATAESLRPAHSASTEDLFEEDGTGIVCFYAEHSLGASVLNSFGAAIEVHDGSWDGPLVVVLGGGRARCFRTAIGEHVVTSDSPDTSPLSVYASERSPTWVRGSLGGPTFDPHSVLETTPDPQHSYDHIVSALPLRYQLAPSRAVGPALDWTPLLYLPGSTAP